MRKDYIKKIFKILPSANLWTLEQVYRCAVNITKEAEQHEQKGYSA